MKSVACIILLFAVLTAYSAKVPADSNTHKAAPKAPLPAIKAAVNAKHLTAAAKKTKATVVTASKCKNATLSNRASSDIALGVCPQKEDWVFRGGFCYKHFSRKNYWYEAELKCRSYNGHLVSINDRSENAFVSKLTYCEKAWTGAYALDVRRLNDSSNYRWTDGSQLIYNAHNFDSIKHIHQPLISLNNLSMENEVYHQQEGYVCKVPQKKPDVDPSCVCPIGWIHRNGFCYFSPNFKARFYEAQFYCSGREANLVSIHSEGELNAMPLLDLDSYQCPVATWVGLVQLEPCREEYSRAKTACYRWIDRSADFTGFPEWAKNHPKIDGIKNCAYLQQRQMFSSECYVKHRFVCKKPAIIN